MTNEEPVPTTSTFLSSAEKGITLTNGTAKKKRGILDIDALWRKKMKENEENGKTPITPTLPTSSKSKEVKTEKEVKKEVKKEEEEEEEEEVEEEEKEEKDEKTVKNKSDKRKRQKSQKMEASIDILTTSKKRNISNSFHLAALENGSANENMELLRTSTSADARSSTTSRNNSQYEFTTLEYPSSVTPATYTLYAPDTASYGSYYQYSANLQSSPPDSGYMVVHGVSQPQAPQSPLSADDNDGSGLGHTNRASPATVQWLLDNYETAEGTSLPRCTLYDHYKKHCVEHRLDPVNAASFGKLIRSVFLGLRTRRLGTRGNSKYHYYGIRIKPDSPLNRSGGGGAIHHHVSAYSHSPGDSYADTVNSVASAPYSGPPSTKRSKTHSSSSSDGRDSSASPNIDMKPIIHHHHQAQQQTQQPQQIHQQQLVTPPQPTASSQPQQHPAAVITCQQPVTTQSTPQNISTPQPAAPKTEATSQAQASAQESDLQAQQPIHTVDMYSPCVTVHDRDGLGKVELPHLTFLENITFVCELRKVGLDMEHVDKFVSSYNYMCNEVLSQVKLLEFESIEDCWVKFWHGNDYTITKDELLLLCNFEPIQDYMIQLDLTLYQTIVDCLIPNVLMSQLSPALTQSCRTFAKNIDVYLRKALQSCGITEELTKKKLQAIKYMQQGLKRYTSLNHLAQAARAVLQKPDQVQQMFTDYARVDMNQVHDQAGWICGCDTMMVQHVNAAFKHNLVKMAKMSDWADWLEGIVDQVLAKYHDKPASVIANVGKQFLLNWSFYTSAIIRDLTLRSAISFGSFHLIRLLADDYMYYLIESRIAKAGKQQIITVIRHERDYPLFRGDTHAYIALPTQKDSLRIATEQILMDDDQDNLEVPI